MILARITDDGVTEDITYMHGDHLGSVSTGTDSTGQIKWTENFSPYGEAINPNAANDNLAAFTGHIRDTDTGLTYMQARYYDPVGARFLSVDPVTFMQTGDSNQFNRYMYADNDPINRFDPDGRDACGLRGCSDQMNIRTGKIRPTDTDSVGAYAVAGLASAGAVVIGGF